MRKALIRSALAAAAIISATMTMAQDTTGTAPEGSADGAPVPVAEVTAEKPSSDSPVTIPLPSPPPTGSGCELHVWPTENYLGFNSGLLSGFGLIGAVADQAAHQGRVKSVKELMADYLGPDIQIEELNKIGLNQTLGLTDYRILIEEPTPSHDDAKAHPEIKAKAKAMNAKIKAGQRLSDSTSACYAELFISYVMYHKAMMYGSNLFVGTMYRNFTTTDGKPIQSVGAVKNPLEHFPPKSPDVIATAQLELREAFAKDFTEWSQKKLKK